VDIFLLMVNLQNILLAGELHLMQCAQTTAFYRQINLLVKLSQFSLIKILFIFFFLYKQNPFYLNRKYS
jgi:hypothetical protein